MVFKTRRSGSTYFPMKKARRLAGSFCLWIRRSEQMQGRQAIWSEDQKSDWSWYLLLSCFDYIDAPFRPVFHPSRKIVRTVQFFAVGIDYRITVPVISQIPYLLRYFFVYVQFWVLDLPSVMQYILFFILHFKMQKTAVSPLHCSETAVLHLCIDSDDLTEFRIVCRA